MRSKKSGAAAVQQNAMGIGGNREEFEKSCVEFVAKKTMAIQGINGEIKEKLREAKEVGSSKMAIRRAVKHLLMSEEQRQSKDEVESETQRITALCADLPLFGGAELAA
jgi:hypothetical protein